MAHTGEIEKQTNNIEINSEAKRKIASIIASAAEEFPCQNCPSKDDCSTYKWYQKWFKNIE